MNKTNSFSQSPFEKDLQNIGKKNPEAMYQIFSDMAHLEETAHSIRAQKNTAITTKVKHMGNGIWQLTSGNYRVWYQFDENDEIEYIKVFKKEKNKTPKRHFANIKNQKKSAISSKKLNIKGKLIKATSKKKKKSKKKE